MRDLIVTNAIVSKGYEDAPPLKFSEKRDSVRFRVGMKVHDTREENGCRWINLTLKAYGNICERIGKMKLKEGSLINFRGTLDEDVWTSDGKEKRMFVAILSDIEFAYSGGKSKENENGSGNSGGNGVGTQQQVQQQQYQQMQPQMNAQQQYQQYQQQMQQQYQQQMENAQQQYQEQYQQQMQQQYQQMQPQVQQQQVSQQYPSQANAQQQYQEQSQGQMNMAGMNNFNGFEAYAGNSMFPE